MALAVSRITSNSEVGCLLDVGHVGNALAVDKELQVTLVVADGKVVPAVTARQLVEIKGSPLLS